MCELINEQQRHPHLVLSLKDSLPPLSVVRGEERITSECIYQMLRLSNSYCQHTSSH